MNLPTILICIILVIIICIGIRSTKKLDNRNQVKIKKISMIFHGFYCTLKIPEEKALFFQGGLGV